MSKGAPFPMPLVGQIAVLRAAVAAGRYEEAADNDRRRTVKLNTLGYLRRDPKVASTWYPTDKGRDVIAWLDAQNAKPAEPAAEVAVVSPDASDLVATVQRARAWLTDGDVIKARIVAAGAYAQAKTEADFAEKFGASEALVAKARQLQADALMIETRAKMIIAKQWDDAQAAGLVGSSAKGGRPKTVSAGNGLLSEDTGLSRKEIHEARKLAAAEERTPGIVERAIAARLAAGLEPTRGSLRASIGAKTATKEERGDNLYQTPPEAMWALLALEKFEGPIWEPACGRGAIVRMLEAAGYDDLILSDLVDYGTSDQFGAVQDVRDFLTTEPRGEGSVMIVTNPPYGENLNAFVAHALRVHRPRKMALLLNINFYFGFEDENRNFAVQIARPSRILAFSHRLPMMHRDGWEGPISTSSMNTAWFIWELDEDGNYATQTVIDRVLWDDFVPAAAPESEAA